MDTSKETVNPIKEKISSGEVKLGGGALFSIYISPQNNTAKYVTYWEVTFQQQDGNWSGSVSSKSPTPFLQTPNLSGLFNVTVTASGPNFSQKQLTPQTGSNPNIGCNSNCVSMVQIVATADGNDANYVTSWDIACK